MEYISAHGVTASTTFQSENAVCLPGLFLSGLPKDLLKKTLVCSFFLRTVVFPWMVAAPSGNSGGFARNAEPVCSTGAVELHLPFSMLACKLLLYHRTSHRYAFQLVCYCGRFAGQDCRVPLEGRL